MKQIFAAAAFAAAIGLAGCAGTAPVTYAPSSTLTATGAVEVTTFAYLPAQTGQVKPNQLRNTALGAIMLDKNIDQFYRDAVFTELRFVGVKVTSDKLKLSGEIKQFLVDDLGYSVDWTTDVHYVVTNKASGAVVYDGEKTTKNNTAKFVNAFGALNEQIKDNIEELIKDPNFIKAIN